MNTNKYVDDLLSFRADITLPRMQESITGIAASGGNHKHTLIKQLGSIRDSENQVIVKVYEDHGDDNYLVFFLFSEYEPKFVIISHPDIFKFYLMKPDNSIVIPKSDGIDPLRDRLSISFPIDIFQTQLETLVRDPESLIPGEMGSEISYAYHQNSRALEVTVLPAVGSQFFDGTKILISATLNKEIPTNTHLFPLRNKQAKFTLPKDICDELTMCIYR